MSNATTIKDRLEALRSLLRKSDAVAAIINTADPHLSEYIADHWKFREWISGFSGSAGTVVVGLDWAGLWTDSRYYLQAAQQLEGTGIELYKEGLLDTPSIAEIICRNTKKDSRVLTDVRTFSIDGYKKLNAACKGEGIQVEHSTCLYDIWSDRPSMPSAPVFVHDIKFAGETATDKINKIKKHATGVGASATLICGLDEIAWVLNLRGSDISYNPVFYAYLVIETDGKTTLYANNAQTGRDLNADERLARHLTECGIELRDYNDFENFVCGTKQQWCYNSSYTNAYIDSLLSPQQVCNETPVLLLKSVKNDIQINGLREAQLVDGVALTQAFSWLDQQLKEGNKVTELSFANYLDDCRAKQANYFSLSFNTISGFAHHGAIVHYGVTPESDIELKEGNFLLVDSGGNYLNGTTDITRTVCLGGNPTAEQKHDYTVVLKGHIALATTPFPEGTSGAQLDTLARQFLWKDARDYGHGTGHGIGHFLCVHEGPQRISMRNNNVPLKCGMFISNEPGLYIEGSYGIRIENMTCVKYCCESQFGKFFELETMSYFPFDLNATDIYMLTKAEIEWINAYHKSTFNKLAGTGLLNEDEKAWLKNKTRQILTP